MCEVLGKRAFTGPQYMKFHTNSMRFLRAVETWEYTVTDFFFWSCHGWPSSLFLNWFQWNAWKTQKSKIRGWIEIKSATIWNGHDVRVYDTHDECGKREGEKERETETCTSNRAASLITHMTLKADHPVSNSHTFCSKWNVKFYKVSWPVQTSLLGRTFMLCWNTDHLKIVVWCAKYSVTIHWIDTEQ